jgi:hypothetical protein
VVGAYHWMSLWNPMESQVFKCNGCARKTEFIWMEQYDAPLGFKIYQCKSCGCIGTKNLAEVVDNDTKVSRCDQCGSWQFMGQKCHTCLLLLDT